MLDVLAAGVLGPLHGDQVFVFARAALHQEPVDVVAALVLVALDEVPAQDEVLGDVVDAVAHQAHRYIVPRHAAVLGFAELVALPVFYALEVHDAVVVEVLAREDVVAQAAGVDVGEWVLVCVPAAEAEVDAADEGEGIVDYDEFLVVCLLSY